MGRKSNVTGTASRNFFSLIPPISAWAQALPPSSSFNLWSTISACLASPLLRLTRTRTFCQIS